MGTGTCIRQPTRNANVHRKAAAMIDPDTESDAWIGRWTRRALAVFGAWMLAAAVIHIAGGPCLAPGTLICN